MRDDIPIFKMAFELLSPSDMKTNEGNLDRIVRIVAGLIFLALVFVGPKTAWGWVGIVPLATGLIGFCPLYKIFGFDTCPLK